MMGMRRVMIMAAMLAFCTVSYGQMMRDMIVSMPDSLMPSLTKVNREDCVDFREADMKACVTNRFGTVTELLELTSDYASWQYTAATSYEMKLLPLSDSVRVMCVVHRVSTPTRDASIHFYDNQWQPLATIDYLILPQRADSASILSTTDMSLSPSLLQLTVTEIKERYVAGEGDASTKMSEVVSNYVWAGGKFVLQGRL